ncbi:hypothetical protein AALO_G00096900 [Alosa alosa]|uniref:Uncharacterized protein n=1 Tax=Alosa alosa TaxID=278164 RepID=A0AAV6GSU2_9TELE|nr:hypothetical protein AALO_G00096900 [Alosa alosa]
MAAESSRGNTVPLSLKNQARSRSHEFEQKHALGGAALLGGSRLMTAKPTANNVTEKHPSTPGESEDSRSIMKWWWAITSLGNRLQDDLPGCPILSPASSHRCPAAGENERQDPQSPCRPGRPLQ